MRGVNILIIRKETTLCFSSLVERGSLIMIIFAGKGGIVTGVLLLTFNVFLFIVSRVAPVLLLKNALLAPKEAYIAEDFTNNSYSMAFF